MDLINATVAHSTLVTVTIIIGNSNISIIIITIQVIPHMRLVVVTILSVKQCNKISRTVEHAPKAPHLTMVAMGRCPLAAVAAHTCPNRPRHARRHRALSIRGHHTNHNRRNRTRIATQKMRRIQTCLTGSIVTTPIIASPVHYRHCHRGTGACL